MKKSALAIFLLVCLVACSIETPPVASGEVSRGLPGPGSASRPLDENQCRAISGWLQSHSQGWSPTPASYVPNFSVKLHYADSSTSVLMLLRDSVVFVSGATQRIRELTPDEVSQLRVLLEPLP